MGLMIAIILGFAVFSGAVVLRGHLEKIHANQRGADVGHLKIDAPMARRILDVKPDASAELINAHYRRLAGKLHPDQGGSAYLLEMVIQAKNILEQKQK